VVTPLETPGLGESIFCANSIDSSACSSISMIANCYNGVCLTGSTEELLGRILQAMTPCPEICDNTEPYGTGVYDIKSGLRLNSNGESILPTPPPPELF